MKVNDKIYVAGHRGMVGSAIVRNLRATGFTNLVTRTSKELDLRDQKAVFDFFAAERPDYVFLAAAKVGGILANNIYRGQFLYDNLMIEANVIEAARVYEVRKLQFL
ncbi:MAG: NAD-dependent epimerase/dehydratase family protein, partial [Bacteroidota bacterium]